MDTTTETQLLDTVLAQVAKFGVTATVEQRDIKIADREVDAYVRIDRGRKTRVYAVEVKKGLRPATLGAVLHQIEQARKGCCPRLLRNCNCSQQRINGRVIGEAGLELGRNRYRSLAFRVVSQYCRKRVTDIEIVWELTPRVVEKF